MPDARRIIHISADFPDPLDMAKTPVIQSLLTLTNQHFDHQVISLNRKSPTLGEVAKGVLRSGKPPLDCDWLPFDGGEALVYSAPAKGMLHRYCLEKLGDTLARRIADVGIPDLLVGHKLTIEGISVRRAAQKLGLPYAITIQGNTDTKILKVRPDLAALFGKIFHEAAAVFALAPWALEQFEKKFGKRLGPTWIVPCPTDLDKPTTPTFGGKELMSVFHLKNHRIKNLRGMTRAVRKLESEGFPLSLQIIGGGSDEEIQLCQSLIANSPSINLAGPICHKDLPACLNRSAGMVLPSLRESFGLVFIEALFAGAPIVYPKGAAIDGYFDGAPFAIAVDAADPRSIAEGMRSLVEDEHYLKTELCEWQLSADARRFTGPSIAMTFADGLRSALSTHHLR